MNHEQAQKVEQRSVIVENTSDIIDIIPRMKNQKMPGTDGLPLILFKEARRLVIAVITIQNLGRIGQKAE